MLQIDKIHNCIYNEARGNTMNIHNFTTQYFNSLSDNDKKDITNWLLAAQEIVGGELSKEKLQDKEIIAKLFLGKANMLSRRKYYFVKRIIISLFDYFEIKDTDVPTLDALLESVSAKKYFKNLQELLDIIDDACRASMKDYNPLLAASSLKCLCTLGWYGFSYQEMSELLGSDIKKSDDLYYIQKGTESIQITQNDWLLLTSFDTLCKTQTYPTGKITNYQESEYLFKSTDIEGVNSKQMSVSTLKKTVTNFNSNNVRGVTISINELKKNGLFEKLYKESSNIPVKENLKKYVSTKTELYALLKEYNSWVKFVME